MLGVPARANTASDDPIYKYLDIYSKVLHLVMTKYVDPVEGKNLVYGSIQGMLNQLDSYSVFLTPEDLADMKRDTSGQFGGVGIEVSLTDGEIHVIAPIEDGPAHKAGILTGDKIIKIDQAWVKDMTLMEALNKLRGRRGTKVVLTLDRAGTPVELTVERQDVKQVAVKTRILEPDVLLIRVAQFQKRTTHDTRKIIDSAFAANPQVKNIVLDLRNNPGGLLEEAVAFSELFVREGSIVYTIDREGNKKVEKAHAVNTLSTRPMVVLVNRGTASASEIVSGALQDYQMALLVGENTYGKGSVQSVMELPDGSGIKLTVAKYYTPKGRVIHEKGIVPDVPVVAKKTGVSAGLPDDQDNQLQEAIRLVRKLTQQYQTSKRPLEEVIAKMIRQKEF
jgi:carboxyl-terminal processing protease